MRVQHMMLMATPIKDGSPALFLAPEGADDNIKLNIPGNTGAPIDIFVLTPMPKGYRGLILTMDTPQSIGITYYPGKGEVSQNTFKLVALTNFKKYKNSFDRIRQSILDKIPLMVEDARNDEDLKEFIAKKYPTEKELHDSILNTFAPKGFTEHESLQVKVITTPEQAKELMDSLDSAQAKNKIAVNVNDFKPNNATPGAADGDEIFQPNTSKEDQLNAFLKQANNPRKITPNDLKPDDFDQWDESSKKMFGLVTENTELDEILSNFVKEFKGVFDDIDEEDLDAFLEEGLVKSLVIAGVLKAARDLSTVFNNELID